MSLRDWRWRLFAVSVELDSSAIPRSRHILQVERNLIDDPDYREVWGAMIPLQRTAEPEEMVGPAVFLASSESSYVTGQTLCVNAWGGVALLGHVGPPPLPPRSRTRTRHADVAPCSHTRFRVMGSWARELTECSWTHPLPPHALLVSRYVDGGWSVQGMVPSSNVEKAAAKNTKK